MQRTPTERKFWPPKPLPRYRIATQTLVARCDSALYGYKAAWRARMSSVRGAPGVAIAVPDPVGTAVQAGVAVNAF